MNKEKTRIEIVILGDVKSGRSALIEQLIYKCGGVDKRTIEKCEKLSATARDRPPFKYASELLKYYISQSNIIIDDMILNRFESIKYEITAIDTPDNHDVLNMIKNIIQADCVVLMVSASIGEFEISISENGQIRQQILFTYLLGAKQMIIAVNKMDADNVSYSEYRFNQIQIELTTYLEQIGYPLKNVAFVPITTWDGDNLVTVSNKMAWFTGSIIERLEGNVICKTFLEILDTIVQCQKRIDKPLRLPIQDVYKVRGIGTVAMGRIETGVLKKDMAVSFLPLNLTATVRSIEICYETLKEAFSGTFVGFNISNIHAKDLQRGLVCSDTQNDPPRENIASFIAQIFMLNSSSQIRQGDRLIIYCHTARIACQLNELVDKIDHQISETIQVYPQWIKSGDLATVKMVPLESVYVEKFDDYPSLGSFIVHDKNKIVAIGIIKDIEYKQAGSDEKEQC